MATNRKTSDVVALALEKVGFAYRTGARPVVRDITLRVNAGEMVGLLGPNGAGKSTVLKLAAGALRPATGRVLLQGSDVAKLGPGETARRVAMAPQDFSVRFAYTVRQIVELGRTPHTGIWGSIGRADQNAVQTALEETATIGLADFVFNELSGGERQRVLLALTLAQEAGIVLLDEPTAHLDIRHQIEVLRLLRRLNRERGLTVIAAMHDLNLAARFFPRLVLFTGEIVADGAPGEVLNSNLLANVYETPVRVGILRGETHLSVLPPGHVDSDGRCDGDEKRRCAEAKVHVIAGCGSGELLMRSLADSGIRFSVGPLNIGDSDYILAEQLATLCLTEPPYAGVSETGLDAVRDCMRRAKLIVVCPVPLGPGNIALLEAAFEGQQSGREVVLLEPQSGEGAEGDREARLIESVSRRDYSGRGAEVYRALLAAGARILGGAMEVVEVVAGKA
ncbi:MAG: hypothetical protein OJF49_000146 [Ktedonobacterales bacterium]|jgi:iron complex transport system ATP-binding protein|nr:MAG: hypothetical protein OJF49_000146 [Ktedonobacterales bacterium]